MDGSLTLGIGSVAPSRALNIQGWTPEADALLADYGGDWSAFEHDCTVKCACGVQRFAGFLCRSVDLNDDGEWECDRCARSPSPTPETELSMLREHGSWSAA